MAKYRVLSLDGGGIRGLLTTSILLEVTRQPGLEHAFDGVDLIAGNSSGSLIALGMAHGLYQPTMRHTLEAIYKLFLQGEKMFGPRWPGILGGYYLRPRYQSESRQAALKFLLGERTTLGDLQRHVLITAFNLNRPHPDDPDIREWRPKVFHNFAGDGTDAHELAWQVAMYSTAAPGYFPTADNYIDGGVFANNPSMCALAQVYDKRYAPDPKPSVDKDVILLSVGAGQNVKAVPGTNLQRGVLCWAKDYVPLTTDGTVGIADYQCGRLLNDNYLRVAPEFPQEVFIDLDDVEHIEDLIHFTRTPQVQDRIAECADWLRSTWMPGISRKALRQRGRNLPEKTSKHVITTTELTCRIPIKPGFLPILNTTTYATRLRIVFKVLQSLRAASRETLGEKPILDIVEAARTVHAFTWTIVEERFLLLNVVFDRPWEPYIRIIWKDLGPLIDLFLCNCDDFVPSAEGFDAFVAFVREHQEDTGFFYPSSSLTVDDQRYLAEFEKRQRDAPAGFESAAPAMRVDSPASITERAQRVDPDEAIRLWMATLDAIYGLRNLFAEDDPDHVFLQQAALTLLEKTYVQLTKTLAELSLAIPDTPAEVWYRNISRLPTVHGVDRPLDAPVRDAVQGGILEQYKRVSHGCVLLTSVENAADARAFIKTLAKRITRASNAVDDNKVKWNIAFTADGLERVGVKESVLEQFPKEFREGMSARAGLLGDVRENHPTNWHLPEWNVRAAPRPEDVTFHGTLTGALAPDPDAPGIRMSMIDIVITLHYVGGADEHQWSGSHPLHGPVTSFCAEAIANGIRVLSIQPLRRFRADNNLSKDHFGLLDGISQPKVGGDPADRDHVEPGELLVGFKNRLGDGAFPEHGGGLDVLGRGSLIDRGSFLVMRKLRQDVDAFHDFRRSVADANLSPDEVVSKMVGRDPAGTPLVPDPPEQVKGKPSNEFDFGKDTLGAVCPFHAHIRRGNPRVGRVSDVPRIARRGMAYGPPYEKDPKAERGLMFMAYNASIAEQFEIIQRWMSGGNTPQPDGSVRVYGGQPDPLLGLPETVSVAVPGGTPKNETRRIYRFVDAKGEPHHVDLGPKAFVTLDWGLYLFVPSIPALDLIADGSHSDPAHLQDIVAAGNGILEKVAIVEKLEPLKATGAWAAVLEDPTFVNSGGTAAVYAAIRAMHGGVLRTPYGVIVCAKELIAEVIGNDALFSVREYQERFKTSIGANYLGMDDGGEYRRASAGPNQALRAVSESAAFTAARELARKVLHRTIEHTAAAIPGDAPLPLPLEPVVDEMLARLVRTWFDVTDGRPFGRDQDQESQDKWLPNRPSDFLAPSRFVFSSPNPRAKVRELGEQSGQRLLRNLPHHGGGTPAGPIAHALSQSMPDESDEARARMLLSLAFGFVPTVYGNALQVLGRWINDETLWRMQRQLLHVASDAYEDVVAVLRRPLERAMLERAVPSMLYRVATSATTLGGCDIQPGDLVVLGIAGAARDMLAHGDIDASIVFGGDRESPDGHPTHACPGRHIAMGVLLGLLTAIMNIAPISPGEGLATVLVDRAYLGKDTLAAPAPPTQTPPPAASAGA